MRELLQQREREREIEREKKKRKEGEERRKRQKCVLAVGQTQSGNGREMLQPRQRRSTFPTCLRTGRKTGGLRKRSVSTGPRKRTPPLEERNRVKVRSASPTDFCLSSSAEQRANEKKMGRKERVAPRPSW